LDSNIASRPNLLPVATRRKQNDTIMTPQGLDLI
jgi:hypothetical protein